MRIILLIGGLATMALAACSRSLNAPDTLEMLKQGDNKVCSADDVHLTLENLLVPQKAPDPSDALASFYLQARKSITFSYDTTTMDSFDQSTSSATCSTNVTGKIGNSDSGVQRITFKIQPTSDGAASFAISLPSDNAAAELALTGLVNTEASRLQAVAHPSPVSSSPPQSGNTAAAPDASSGETTTSDTPDNTGDDANGDNPSPPLPAPPRGLY